MAVIKNVNNLFYIKLVQTAIKENTPLKERKLFSTNRREITNNQNSIANISQFSFAEKEFSLAATIIY